MSAKAMEIMLRSMGLGQIVEVAEQMAKAGAAEKILRFADNADDIVATLRSIDARLARLEAGPGPGIGGPIQASVRSDVRARNGSTADGPRTLAALGDASIFSKLGPLDD